MLAARSVVVEEYQSDHPDATLSVGVADSLTAPVDEEVLVGIIDTLVENAVEHNDAETPVVTVDARETDGGVWVSVLDNVPGIPSAERAVIETGEEDSLEHGSGLGLWAVKWGGVRLVGEMTFEDRKPRGTVVTIEFPTDVLAETTATETAVAN